MWTNLFQRATPGSPMRDVARVVGPPRPAPVPMPGRAAARPCAVAENVERVDSVDSSMVDSTDTNARIRMPTIPGAAQGVLPLRAEVPTVPVSVSSTLSTPSTPGKHCRLLTTSEKNELMALFRLDLITVDMQASVDGLFTADELWRTNNVAWRLVTVEGMTFDAAMLAAAQWVAANPPHPDERNFVNVLSLHQKGAT
jgi:hypothetical protein